MREYDYTFPIKPGMSLWRDQSDEYKQKFYEYQKGYLAKEKIRNQPKPKPGKRKKRISKNGRVEVTI